VLVEGILYEEEVGFLPANDGDAAADEYRIWLR